MMSDLNKVVLERLLEAPSPDDVQDWPEEDNYYVAACRVSKDDVPSLIDVARLWIDDDSPACEDLPDVDPCHAELLPVTAWRALGDLRAEEAIEPLVDLLRALQGDVDEWVWDDLPFVFGKIGKAAIEPLAELARDKSVEFDARECAVAGLAEIAKTDPDTRDRVVAILMSILEAGEDHIEVNSQALVGLVELGAVEAAELIERAFSENRLDVGLIGDWNDVRRQLGVEGLGLSMPEHPFNSIEEVRRSLGIGIFSDRAIFNEDESDEHAAMDYLDQAWHAFSKSPEAQLIRKKYGDIGWYGTLLHFGLDYRREVVDAMSLDSVRKFVMEHIPRTVMVDPESAQEIIDELAMVWKFLGRVYCLPQANEIVEWLSADGRVEELKEKLTDDENFGMAKSIILMGQEAGFDITTQEGREAFIAAYNAHALRQHDETTSAPRATSASPFDADGAAPSASRRDRRNRACPCGSGKKYKKCCGRR